MVDLLTPHFTLAELTVTTRTDTGDVDKDGDTAERIPNAPNPLQRAALVDVCRLLEIVRAHFGAPVVVHSGFRSPAVNAAVGGSPTSQHMRGEAADFHVAGVDLETVWRWIAVESGMRFGQLILEGRDPARPTWIHLSIRGTRAPERCQEVMRWDASGGYKRVRPEDL